MAVEFRGENGNPEHLVGVSPVHEHEINVPGSVGDYNQHMIQGFRLYLLQQFGSLEQINQKLGTTFASVDEIDPPRDSGRGEWDLYQGDYFTQWALYKRYIVSKRSLPRSAYRRIPARVYFRTSDPGGRCGQRLPGTGRYPSFPH